MTLEERVKAANARADVAGPQELAEIIEVNQMFKEYLDALLDIPFEKIYKPVTDIDAALDRLGAT